MENTANKIPIINKSKIDLSVVKTTEQQKAQRYHIWLKFLAKPFSSSNDLNLETFDRIESKKIIRPITNSFN